MTGIKSGSKLRQTMIAKHGSEAAWKAHMKEIARKGGKNGNKKTNPNYAGGFANPNSSPAEASKKGLQKRWKK